MLVDVTFRNMDGTDALRRWASERAEHVTRIVPNDTLRAHFVLTAAPHESTAELDISGNGVKVHASAGDLDLYRAIDAAATKAEAQLRKVHERRAEH